VQRHACTGDRPPSIDLAGERRLGEFCSDLIADGTVRTAHDVADGGLAVALTEMCFASNVGCRVEVETAGRSDVALFGESGCRIVIAVAAGEGAGIEARAAAADVACRRLGTSGGDAVRIAESGSGRVLVDVRIERLRSAWDATLPAIAHADTPQAKRAAAGG